jgi:hypothetical protein
VSHLQETIDMFEQSLLPGHRLDRQAALALLGCDRIANKGACTSADLPHGSTWGQVAAEALNRLSRAA